MPQSDVAKRSNRVSAFPPLAASSPHLESVRLGKGTGMDTLKIALETLLVGALAVPWLLLGLHLFFPEAKAFLRHRLPSSDDSIRYAIVAVMAVALAYTVGAAVSRLAQDFYNDDDFGLPLPPQDSIRASVYCDREQPWIFDTGVTLPADAGKPKTFCDQRNIHSAKDREAARQSIQQIFELQESALLLLGESNTSQIRHLHQQLLVLQGAGFDGLITWMLCLFAWNAERAGWGRWRRALPIALFLYVVLYALLWNHLEIHQWSGLIRLFYRWTPSDPPFMEFALILLAAAGYYLASKKPDAFVPSAPRGPAVDRPAETPGRVSYSTGMIVSFLLTAVAYSGWYWTEILYDRLVIYSFYASHGKLF